MKYSFIFFPQDENYILSGAHCLENAQLVEVIVGAHNISDPNEVGQVRLTSTEIKIHEGWSSFFARDDLALVKLPVPLVFDSELAWSTSMVLYQYIIDPV